MKRKLYFWAKKYVNSANIKLVVLAIPLSVILAQQVIAGEFVLTDFFDVSILITFLLLAVCDGIAAFIQKKIAKNTEDSAKLTDQYEKLSKKYKCTNLVRHEGVAYPVEHLWTRKGNEQIVFQDNPHKFYNLPSQIAANSKEIMEAHSASTVYNQINVRLDNLIDDPEHGRLILQTSRTQYFDSLITNRACDYVFGDRKITARELYEPGPFIKPLALSKMSNHLGYSGFVFTSDTHKIPFILRNKNLSIAKNLWSSSISASLKTVYALDYQNNFTLTDNALGRTIVGEIRDELHIAQDRALTAENAQKGIFAFYRDLVECGKPQFIFTLELQDTTEAMLEESITGFKPRKRSDQVMVDGTTVAFFSLEDLRKATYKIDSIVIKGDEYKMTPSSIVSILLFLKYMENGQ